MKRKFDNLLLLIDGIPDYNMLHYRNELSKMLSHYRSILDQASHNLKDYNFYNNRIIAIENNLAKAKHAITQFEKDQAYSDAVKALKSDIKELLSLIKVT